MAFFPQKHFYLPTAQQINKLTNNTCVFLIYTESYVESSRSSWSLRQEATHQLLPHTHDVLVPLLQEEHAPPHHLPPWPNELGNSFKVVKGELAGIGKVD